MSDAKQRAKDAAWMLYSVNADDFESHGQKREAWRDFEAALADALSEARAKALEDAGRLSYQSVLYEAAYAAVPDHVAEDMATKVRARIDALKTKEVG